jgi:uncharacterized protein YaaW (UPF0174 family)
VKVACELHIIRESIAERFAKLERPRQRELLAEVCQNMRERCQQANDYSEVAEFLLQQLGGDAASAL